MLSGEQASLVAQNGSYVSDVKCLLPYIRLFTGEYVCIYIYVYMYIYICICIYIYSDMLRLFHVETESD